MEGQDDGLFRFERKQDAWVMESFDLPFIATQDPPVSSSSSSSYTSLSG